MWSVIPSASLAAPIADSEPQSARAAWPAISRGQNWRRWVKARESCRNVSRADRTRATLERMRKSMRFGLFGNATAVRGGPDVDSSFGYREFIDYNVEAEALGYHSTFLVEHHFT